MAFQIDRTRIRGSAPEWRSDRERWQTEYGRRVRVCEALVLVATIGAAQLIRFGGIDDNDQMAAWSGDASIGYSIISVLLALSWFGFLVAGNAASPGALGTGLEEYRQLTSATLRLFGLIGIVSLLFRLDFARGYLAIALPFGLLGLLVNRMLWRRYAAAQRRSGRYRTAVLVLGGPDAAREMMTCFARDPAVGYSVVGVYSPYDKEFGGESELPDVPILVGAETTVLDAVRQTGSDLVAISATEHLGARGINDLVWQLAPLGVGVVVTPGVVDVADQRMAIRPIGNLPLLHIAKPQYGRSRSFGRAVFDLTFAVSALLLVSPVMLIAAVAIKIDSRGPVFYRSERIGLDGVPFRMIKFRSMFPDADQRRAALESDNEGAGPLFKIREDPRVTPIGRILRRYSLDELPQFINVIRREMSVVGPRPPLPGEVERYDGKVRRRLLVKPGVTGLWQVSGRSDLSWDESVRLDLSYVENWSMVQDLLIIAKTITAVTRSDGAY
ncbi:exopolysaccharide biosynthesis polyprenyl glycosylphosphotransferase [Nocardia sp. ET3-3]|uniref:Exopolysaccharide biosynthesis polyprenyl glycosylphosphotransferase n=1 Tax=Nocardia terrae TaxID=2675851 RepID=A0A7K1USL2_9NOCA|nr:sugar transferase [Nocardia terrae]MVU77324.1 exopolysaccharide biosynthesis polyprenyl glycosylphosphotransferase [Nocardia terrae]